jgi:hypothetical protein
MNEKMEPVLSAEEWARAKDEDALTDVPVGEHVVAYVADGIVRIALLEKPGVATGALDQPARAIALLNDALPDSDPRKVTREKIEAIRLRAQRSDYVPESGEDLEANGQWPLDNAVDAFLDALESYLPPE